MVKEKLKGLSKDALIYGAGDALGRMIGLVMLPILSRIFGPADYGAIDLLAISYQFLLTTLNLGVPTGVQRFYFRSEPGERNLMLTSALALLLAIASIGGLIVALLASSISAVIIGDGHSLRVPVLILALQMPIEQLWVYQILLLRMQRRAIAFAVSSIAMVILTPTLTFTFVAALRMGLTGVFLAGIISFTVVTIGLTVINRSQFARGIRFAYMKEVVAFALPGHPGQLVRQSMTLLPRYLLASFAPLAAVGLFGIASRVGSIVRIFVEALNRSWNPFAYSNEGSPDEKRLYEIVFKAVFICLLFIVTSLSVLAPEVLGLLTPAGYEGAAALVPGVLVYLGIDGLILMLSPLLYTRNRVHWTSYLGLLKLAVLLAVGLFLVPRYHANGLVVALIVAALVHLVGYVAVVLSVFEMSFPVLRMSAATAIAVSAVATIGRLQWDLALLLPLKIGAVLVVSTLTVFLILDRSERKQVLMMVSRGRGRP